MCGARTPISARGFQTLRSSSALRNSSLFMTLAGSAKSKGANAAEGQGRNPVGQRVLQLARIDDPQVFLSPKGRSAMTMCMDFVVFGASEHLNSNPSSALVQIPAAQQQQVQLCPSLGPVEVRLVSAVGDECLLEGESLPTGAVARVEGELIRVFKTQQEMKDAAVAQEHPRRLDEPLSQILDTRGATPGS